MVDCVTRDGDAICGAVSGVGAFIRRLELIDVEGGRLIAQTDVAAEILGFLDSETVWSFRMDEIGHPFIEIWRVSYPL